MANTRKTFSKIYDENVRRIYRFVFLKVSSEEIAQDLTSQTFLKGWEAFKKSKIQNPKSKKREIKNPSAFLYQIARNLVIDYYREKGRTTIVSAEYANIVDPRPNPGEEAVLESDFQQAQRAIANLKDDYQNVIIWHYLDGFSFREIANILNKSEGAVRVSLHRALKALRAKMDPHSV